jgi:hypothetical protein
MSGNLRRTFEIRPNKNDPVICPGRAQSQLSLFA